MGIVQIGPNLFVYYVDMIKLLLLSRWRSISAHAQPETLSSGRDNKRVVLDLLICIEQPYQDSACSRASSSGHSIDIASTTPKKAIFVQDNKLLKMWKKLQKTKSLYNNSVIPVLKFGHNCIVTQNEPLIWIICLWRTWSGIQSLYFTGFPKDSSTSNHMLVQITRELSSLPRFSSKVD